MSRSLFLPKQWALMVDTVAAADADGLSDANRLQISHETAAAVKGDGTRKLLAARYGVSLDVIEHIARNHLERSAVS